MTGMSFRIVDRPLAEAVGEQRPQGPRWVVPPRAEGEIACIWARHALVGLPLFVPILPPGETYIDDFQAYRRPKYDYLAHPSVTTAVARHLTRLADVQGTGCFVLGGSTNYYHWLIDFLPKCWMLTREPRLQVFPMLVNGGFSAMQRETLAFVVDSLGLAAPRVEPLGDGGFAAVAEAYLPTRVWRVAAVGFWRRVIERTIYEVAGPPQRRLFVIRAGTDRRRLRDEAALAARLQRHGFEAVDPGSLPFVEQIKLFASARIVVGVHGAGLTNMIFSRRELTLIELRAPQNTTAYAAFATIRQQRYVEIPVTVEAEGHRDEAHRDVVLSAEGEAAVMRAIAEVR